MEHNSQLELQLQRLRQLVLEESNGGGTGGQFGTLQSKSVIAKDLHVQSPRGKGFYTLLACARINLY